MASFLALPYRPYSLARVSGCLLRHRCRRRCRTGHWQRRQRLREPYVADEKDMESDEALWAFYERWCKHYNLERDHDEMAHRFDEFKRTVFMVHQVNNANLPYKLEVNMFADVKLAEIYGSS
nr:unnamed protein product [Digitaria exilis]